MDRKTFLGMIAGCLVAIGGVSGPARAVEPVPPVAVAAANPAEAPAKSEETAKPDSEETPAPADVPLLMQGWDAVGLKKAMDSIGLLTYGYVESGFTGRLIGGQHPLPLRLFDGPKPDNLLLDQLKLTVERPIDRTKALDFGGRFDMIYGSDARFIHSLGLTDTVAHPDEDNTLDIEQLYVQGFWGKGNKEGEGLDIIFGKFVTPFGAEVIDAPGNALYSHSMLFNYAIPFAHTGVKANYTFGPQGSAYIAAVRGWDVFNDNNDAWSIMTGGVLNTAEQVGGAPRASLALNVITGPEQTGNVSNFRTVIDMIGTYHWNDKFTQIVNWDYGTEQHGTPTGAAHWTGIAHYLTYAFTDIVSGTWRAEWFQDHDGVRTGITGDLYEMTWGVSLTPFPKHPIFKNLIIRPEIRWDFTGAAQDAFGGNDSQLTAAFDIIFKF